MGIVGVGYCKNSQPSSNNPSPGKWRRSFPGQQFSKRVTLRQRYSNFNNKKKYIEPYKWHLMVMKESSNADLSHTTVSLEAGPQSHPSASQLDSHILITGQRYLCSCTGSPTTPMPPLFATRFQCYGKRENHLFSPLKKGPFIKALP